MICSDIAKQVRGELKVEVDGLRQKTGLVILPMDLIDDGHVVCSEWCAAVCA